MTRQNNDNKLDAVMELDEEWQTGKRYLNMNAENDEPALQPKKIYRKNVA